jgi:hypothetical protein
MPEGQVVLMIFPQISSAYSLTLTFIPFSLATASRAKITFP